MPSPLGTLHYTEGLQEVHTTKATTVLNPFYTFNLYVFLLDLPFSTLILSHESMYEKSTGGKQKQIKFQSFS